MFKPAARDLRQTPTTPGTFRVYFTNFGWYAANGAEYPTVDAAIGSAKLAGYEAQIVSANGDVVATWSIIGGTRLV